ncbi:sugar ABC transporter substrate-binding protein [Arachnia propionica]|uniref:Sugar ABC transporter substrate-binding protein n=1 Tax=Arachnia propionica TaxID=1750 RepID=A0A3P1T4N1_9ACTN|nr:sugar ABC transporter substrate-binding protein [Arachnia propionica]RRD03383.1 sugar ABC transporter substrate-binding protein [Arachnia propionica]
MMKRRIAAAAVAAALALTLGACDGGKSGKGEQANQMYTWVSSPSDREQWESFVKGAQEKDADFKLEIEGPTFAEYWTKVKTRMSSGDAPCIITTQAARAQELGSLLSPLDELAKEAGVDLTQYNSAMMEGLTVDGTVRAIPYDAEPMVLYYNKDMFKAAGLQEPGLDYTTEQFLSDAKALTSGDVMGFAVAPAFGYPYLSFAFANGHTPTKDGELTLTDPGLVEDVQWGFDLVAKEKVATAPSSADVTDVSMQNFMSGKAAMVIEGPWFYSTIKEGTKAEVGVAVVPSKSGKPIGMIQGSGFGISAKCPDKKAAFANIMKMTTPEVIAHVGKHRGTVPSLEASMSGWAEGKPEADVAVMEALLKDGKPLVTTTNWNQVDTQFAQYSPEGVRGERTAEDILSAIEKGIK